MTAAKNLAIMPAPVPTSQVVLITLDLLDASPNNPRRTMDDKGLEELAASIKASGINSPLLVRPDAWTEGLIEERYEIVCGHRRCEAATLAGLEEVPCIVRSMTDQEANEIALVDNLQRVDVPALEEAEAFGKLLALHGTVEAVAARVGKDVAHVAKRLRLQSLGTWSCDALGKRLITVDHALLLARVGVAEQDQALKWCLDRNAGSKTPVDRVIAERDAGRRKEGKSGYHWEPESPQRLKEHIEQSSGRKLSRAPWDLDDAELVRAAGACSSCPSNTKANTSLFSDLAIEAATCADGACFESKRSAFVQIALADQAEQATAKGKLAPVRVSWKSTSVKPAWAKTGDGPNLDKVFKVGQWAEAKKMACEHVRAGVVVDWSDDANRGYMGTGEKLRKPGQVLSVCVAPKCKAHKKEWEKPKSQSSDNGQRYDPKAEEEKREKLRVAALAETKLRARLAGEAVEKITILPEQLLRRFLIDQIPTGSSKKVFEAICPGLEKTVRSAALDSAEFARAVALLSIEDRHVEVREHWDAKQFRKEFISDLKLLGYDASKAWDTPKAAVPAKKAAPKKKGAKR